MLNLVLFGAPGCGKGTQSAKLIDAYGLYHISTGDVLRRHIAEKTELGRIADSYIKEGRLIPDDLMISILDAEMDKNPTDGGVIFDGFPRTIPQADALAGLLAKRGTELHAVVGLEVPDEELIKRLINRGKETHRSDDNPETIKNRLEVYHTQTQPLKEYYTQGGKYISIDGLGVVNDIFEKISAEIKRATGVETIK